MKCGKETVGNDVFCAECLAEMARYPVKPGTAVQIPQRPAAQEPRRPARRRKEPPVEEQLATMKSLIQRLLIAVLCMATVLAVTLGCLFYVLAQPEDAPPEAPMSRNYSTSAEPDE